MNKNKLKKIIENLYYDYVNKKIKTQIIPDDVKKQIEEHTSFYVYDKKGNLNVRCHFILNDITELKRCLYCNAEIHPVSLPRYKTQNYCNSSCSNKHHKKKEKSRETHIKRYGVEYASQSPEIRKKITQSFIDRYGVENPAQSPEIQKKTKQTVLDKFGVDNVFKNEEFRKKAQQTTIERYGVDNVSKCDTIREKTKKTNLQKYGTEYVFQNEDVKDKIKKTLNEKYGEDHPMLVHQIREKLKQTNLLRYGSEYVLGSSEIIEKRKQTNLEKYGFENPAMNEKIREKIKKTNLEKYGFENPMMSSEIQEKIKKTNLEKYGVENHSYSHLSSDAIEIINDKEKFSEFVEDKTAYELSKKLGIYQSSFYVIANRYDVSNYFKRSRYSYLEIEMAEFLDELNINYEKNNRSILNGFELDFYIQDYNMAIEMNGIYWHSDLFISDKNYHYNKWKWCSNKGIHLISIFEDDWNSQKEKIKNIIKTKLGLTPIGTLSGESLIQKIDENTARTFLEKYHLNGFAEGIHFGAFDGGDNLIAVVTFKHIQDQKFELSRFVTNNSLYFKLFSKIFKYAQNNLNFKEVVWFSDNTIFSENIHEENGFEFVREIEPEYHYLFKGKRVHRTNLEKYDLKNQSITSSIEEEKLTDLTGISKIYDCGKVEWRWKSS